MRQLRPQPGRQMARAVSLGLIGSAALALGAYWLERYLRPRHSALELNGSVAVIPEADSALGQAFARALAYRGLRLILAGRDPDVLLGLRLAVDPYAADVLTVTADSRTAAGQSAIIEAAMSHHGRIDLLIMTPGPIAAALHTGLPGVIALTRAALPIFRQQNSGRIVYLLSTAGWLAMPGLADYAAAAQGITGFADALRHELSGTAITISSVSSGWTREDTAAPSVQRWLSRMNWPLVSTETVISATIVGLLNGQPEIFVGSAFDRLLVWLTRHIPLLMALYWRTVNSPDWLTAAHDLSATGR